MTEAEIDELADETLAGRRHQAGRGVLPN